MRKFLSALVFIIFCGFSNFCSANVVTMNLVRISDYSIGEFYINFNRIARDVMTNDIFMTQYPANVAEWSDDNYDVYATGCKLETEKVGTVVFLYANKEGHVSYIKAVGIFGNVLNGTLTNLFTTIGLSYDEIKKLFDMLKNNDNALIHSNSINRNIMVQIEDSKDVQAKEISVYAVKEK